MTSIILVKMVGMSSSDPAVKYHSVCEHPNESIVVQAIISASAPTDLTDTNPDTSNVGRHTDEYFHQLFGQSPTLDELKSASPIYKANEIGINKIPPLLAFHSDIENLS